MREWVSEQVRERLSERLSDCMSHGEMEERRGVYHQLYIY